MADIGTAYVRVAPNMTGIQGKIAAGFKGAAGPATAALGAEVESNTGPFQAALGKLGDIAKGTGIAIGAGLAVGIAGLATLTGKALMAGAELEQQLGGAEAVFGAYADGIKQAAEDAYFQAGLSQAEFLQGANKMGSLFQGAGFDVQTSMKMSADSMQRASDIASIMGISTTEALEAVTGMAKGNFTMMDNLGVAMNDTAIAAYAAANGIDKSTQQMSIQEKVGLAQQMFMEKTAKYAGNYAKENQTLAGSLNSTKKAFDNLMSGQGDIDGFIELLVNTIEIAIPKIVEILPKLVKGVEKVFAALVPALAKSLPTLVPALISAVTALLNAVVAAMPMIVQTLLAALPSIIAAFVQLFTAIRQALPQIVRTVSQALPTIITAIVTGLTAPESLQAIILGSVQLLMAIIEAIPIIIPALVGAIPTIVKNIVSTLTDTRFLRAMGDAGVQLLKATIDGIGNMIGQVADMATKIINKIKEILSPEKLAEVGKAMVEGLWNGINSLADWVIDKIKGFGQGVLNAIKDFFGIKSPSKVFAGIGVNLNEGFAKGIDSSTGLVSKSIDDMANQALSAMTSAPINAIKYGAAGNPSLPSSVGGSTTTQNVSIQKIVLGDDGAVKEFFKQLNQDTINLGMGVTPNQGAIA